MVGLIVLLYSQKFGHGSYGKFDFGMENFMSPILEYYIFPL